MENTDTKTIMVFSAALQRESPHTLDIDGNGEVILTCTETGNFLKFPHGTTVDELKELLVQHKEHNEGQISIDSIEAQKKELIDGLTTVSDEQSA